MAEFNVWKAQWAVKLKQKTSGQNKKEQKNFHSFTNVYNQHIFIRLLPWYTQVESQMEAHHISSLLTDLYQKPTENVTEQSVISSFVQQH